MSTKIQASAKSPKKAPLAAAAKAAPAAKGKTAKPAPAAGKGATAKGATVAKPAALAAKGEELPTDLPTIDPDEAEEQEDAARASAGASDGNAAALAAASGSTEMSASFKNFRHHPDMENFYRFIYENDLRHEALHIIDQIQVEKVQRRQMKTLKANAH